MNAQSAAIVKPPVRCRVTVDVAVSRGSPTSPRPTNVIDCRRSQKARPSRPLATPRPLSFLAHRHSLPNALFPSLHLYLSICCLTVNDCLLKPGRTGGGQERTVPHPTSDLIVFASRPRAPINRAISDWDASGHRTRFSLVALSMAALNSGSRWWLANIRWAADDRSNKLRGDGRADRKNRLSEQPQNADLTVTGRERERWRRKDAAAIGDISADLSPHCNRSTRKDTRVRPATFARLSYAANHRKTPGATARADPVSGHRCPQVRTQKRYIKRPTLSAP
uniref:Uncharacterized protein n=1 Tax=Plectus sambesii TaxID=2011161 RepID=A0A914WGH8_9BILA